MGFIELSTDGIFYPSYCLYRIPSYCTCKVGKILIEINLKRFLLSFSIPRDSVLNFFTESCEPEAFDCPNDAQCIEDVLAGGNE